jgi:hypothetical protein
MENGVIGILRHSGWRTFPRRMLGYNLASGRVRVAKKAAVLNASQKEMVGKKFKVCGFNVFAETMNLNTSVIVDVSVLFLGKGKILVVMQPFGITNRLVQMQFAAWLASSPFTRCNMTFSPSQEEASAIPRVICSVRAHVKLELDRLLCLLNAHGPPYLILADFVGTLQLAFWLQKAFLGFEQDLRILRPQYRVFVFGLNPLEVGT